MTSDFVNQPDKHGSNQAVRFGAAQECSGRECMGAQGLMVANEPDRIAVTAELLTLRNHRLRKLLMPGWGTGVCVGKMHLWLKAWNSS